MVVSLYLCCFVLCVFYLYIHVCISLCYVCLYIYFSVCSLFSLFFFLPFPSIFSLCLLVLSLCLFLSIYICVFVCVSLYFIYFCICVFVSVSFFKCHLIASIYMCVCETEIEDKTNWCFNPSQQLRLDHDDTQLRKAGPVNRCLTFREGIRLSISQWSTL